ncbi:MAG: PSD1 and planctomycete cytochrome C domain-containing protein [Akkermansiaceae bacterium]
MKYFGVETVDMLMLRPLLYNSLFLALSVGAYAADEGFIFFEEKVRPILAENCLKCHSEEKKIKGGLLLDRKAGWEAGGDSGAVIVLGKPEESLLIHMVKREDDYEAMPPKTALGASEIATLEEWIKMGAPDPRDQAIGEKATENVFDLEARKSWWSLQPVQKVAVPEVKDSAWPRNDFDSFILAGLDQQGWKPADSASREQLFRRASVTLTGLSPTPEQLAEVLADKSDTAYEKAVERFLDSPHFGEHWARHWMDVVRFGETKSFENDYTMAYTWRFRDYLTRAFNADVPFDKMTLEAFAGDLLENPRVDPATGLNESAIGPGFLLFTDGQHGPTDLHEDEARVFDGMIQAVGAAYHGLTISCARCHDHKFDAITDEDYYSLYGTLKSSRLHHANLAEIKWTAARQHAFEKAHQAALSATFSSAKIQADQLPQIINQVRALAKSDEFKNDLAELAKLTGEPHATKLASLRAALIAKSSPKVAQWFLEVFTGTTPELAGLRYWLLHQQAPPLRPSVPHVTRRTWKSDGAGFAQVGKGAFVVNPTRPRVIVASAGQGMIAGHLSPRLDGAIRSEDFTLDGSPVEIWVKGHAATANLVVRNFELSGAGPTTSVLRKQINTDQWTKLHFPTVLWKNEIAYLEILQQGRSKIHLRPSENSTPPSDEAWAAVAHQLPDWNEAWQDDQAIAERLNSLLTRDDLSPAETEVLGALFSKGLLKPASENPALAELQQLRDAVETPVYARSLVDGDEHHEPIYIRGNYKRPSETPNPRHFLDGLGGEMLSAKGSGRLAWAERVVDPSNPLTARVRANRIWSRVFGRGIVASVDDFGKMGQLPSHPELLDFLATDFVSEGWSTKTLLRKLLTSSTFRMSSVPSSRSAELDPDNQWLQHMPIRRMSAESIRDHLLASSGELKLELFGKGIRPYVQDQPHSRAKPPSGPLDGAGRRSIYLEVRRNFLPSFLRAFNFPPSTEPVGQRPITTVPAQSLALLNHPLVHDQAGKWARRILNSPASTEERLALMHRQGFARDPQPDEITWGLAALDQLGVSEDPQAAWTSLCHLMMNRKEFIYVF